MRLGTHITSAKVRSLLLVPAVAIIGLVGAACGGADASAGLPSGERTIYMSALEYKGTATTEKEAFPTKALPAGSGYGLTDLKTTPASWQVNAYAWAPDTITVVEGDKVTLNIVGINGGSGHASSIEGHVEKFDVKRGELTTLNFTAGKPGIYKIICTAHAPNMVGHMVVLPASK